MKRLGKTRPFWRIASSGRQHFPLPVSAPLPDFEAIAGCYPVYRIDPSGKRHARQHRTTDLTLTKNAGVYVDHAQKPVRSRSVLREQPRIGLR